MAYIQFQQLLFCVCILVTQTTTGVSGWCLKPPVNQAVFEGAENLQMTCNGTTALTWKIYPTDNEANPTTIISLSDDTITSDSLKQLYMFENRERPLLIKKAQSSPTIPPITTSGIYVASYRMIINSPDKTQRAGAKLVVVREAPKCSCTTINAGNKSASCSITYADAAFDPIYPRVAWLADDVFLLSDILKVRTKVNNGFTSTSTFNIGSNDKRKYKCRFGFTSPTSTKGSYIAKNVPVFQAFCEPNC